MANDINKVVLVGNLVRNCEGKDFSYTQSGTCVARVSIAVNRSYVQNGQKTDNVSYFDITIFGKMAEALKPYLQKGKKVCVSGYLKQDRWTDQQGNNRSRVGIIAEDIQLFGGIKDQQTGTQSAGYVGAQQQYQSQASQSNYQQNQYHSAQLVRQFSQDAAQTQKTPYQQQAQYQPSQIPQNEMEFPEDIPF